MSSERQILFVKRMIIAISAVIIVWKGVIPGLTSVGSDFPNYWLSSKLFLDGESLVMFYDNDWFSQKGDEFEIKDARFIPFPPLTALVLIPVSFLAPLHAKWVWITFNVLLLLYCIKLSVSLIDVTRTDVLLVYALCAIPITNNFLLGQMYVILLWSMLESFRLLQSQKVWTASFIVMFTASFKYVTALLFIPFILVSRSKAWKAISVLVVLIAFLQVLLFGFEASWRWLEILISHLTGHIPGQGQHPYAFQSLESLLSNLFTYNPVYNPSPIAAGDFVKPIIKSAVYISFLSIAGFVVWRFRESDKMSLSKTLIIMMFFLMMALTPASATYHMILLIPSTLFVVELTRTEYSNFWIYLFLGCFALASNFLPHWVNVNTGHQVIDVSLRYPRLFLVWAMFLLVSWMLIRISKRRLDENQPMQ